MTSRLRQIAAIHFGFRVNTSEVRALDVAPDGFIWAAGTFTTFNGASTGGVVKLNGDPVSPAIIHPPVTSAVLPGETAIVVVGAHGTGLTYQCFKNTVALVNGGDISGANTSILAIANADATDEADYTVAVTHTATATTLTSAAARLHVLAAPRIIGPPSPADVLAGVNLTLASET